MEEKESMVVIATYLQVRLEEFVSSKHLRSPPKRMRKRRTDSVFIGKATEEQQALSLFYNQVVTAHGKLHKASGEPFGINPYVDSPHYRLHVLQPLLYEMLQWSVHRAYPEIESSLQIRFDKEWNMYATPRRENSKKTTKNKKGKKCKKKKKKK